MRHYPGPALLAATVAGLAIAAVAQQPDPQISARARALHTRAIVVDTHDDTTQRLHDRRHAARRGEVGRRGDDQLQRRLFERGAPYRAALASAPRPAGRSGKALWREP